MQSAWKSDMQRCFAIAPAPPRHLLFPSASSPPLSLVPFIRPSKRWPPSYVAELDLARELLHLLLSPNRLAGSTFHHATLRQPRPPPRRSLRRLGPSSACMYVTQSPRQLSSLEVVLTLSPNNSARRPRNRQLQRTVPVPILPSPREQFRHLHRQRVRMA